MHRPHEVVLDEAWCLCRLRFIAFGPPALDDIYIYIYIYPAIPILWNIPYFP